MKLMPEVIFNTNFGFMSEDCCRQSILKKKSPKSPHFETAPELRLLA